MSTFEEKFPSLSAMTATMDFADGDEGERYKPIKAGMFFGALAGEGAVVHVHDVEEHCLDKAMVKEALDNFLSNIKKELGLQ